MKPLNGLRILEFDGLGPVTFAGMMLADLGAEVLRLRRGPGAGSAVFAEVGGDVLHRARAAVDVDLKRPQDVAAVLDLIAGADALIEGFRPGVMERLGLGPDACMARNPRLIYGRITGWGQTGPMADRVGHDLNYIALSGALHAIGPADRPPPPPLNLIGDYGGGAMLGVVGVLAGLLQVKAGGRGQVVDAAMIDGSALMMGLFHALAGRGLWSDQRGANLLDGGAPFYRCYGCRDGRFVAVAALEPRFFAALLAGLDLQDFTAQQFDLAAWPELHARLEAVFATRDRDVWAAHFEGSEACVTPVLTLGEAAAHPHNRARSGEGQAVHAYPAQAPRFGDAPPSASAQPPPLSLADAVAAWGS